MTTAIVARLRARAESESITAHRADVEVPKADRCLYAASVLREEADAIEAAMLTSELDDACAFLEPEKLVALLKKAPRGQSTWMISREIAPTLAEAIIATARALGWKPQAR